MAKGPDSNPELTNEQAQKILINLFTIARHLRPSGMSQIQAHGDPPAPRHVIALFHLGAKGPMSVSELANSLGVTLTTASLLVTQMAASGLAIRKEDPNDHRRTIVSTSHKVKTLVDETLTVKLEALTKGLETLGPQRSASLLRDLEILSKVIEENSIEESPENSKYSDQLVPNK